MKGSLAGRYPEALRSAYRGLGFTVTPRGQHPFGTGNSIVQLHGHLSGAPFRDSSATRFRAPIRFRSRADLGN